MSKTFVALYYPYPNDLVRVFEDSKINCYDGIVIPIVNPLYYREFENDAIQSEHFAFSRSDLILTSEEWLYRTIALLTDSIDCDSEDEIIRRHSEVTLKQEMSFAEHLIQGGHMMLKLKSMKNTNLAQIIGRSLKGE